MLKESLPDGWWKVELNGVVSRILIGKVKSIKRQKSSEEKDSRLTRSISKKDASANGITSNTSIPADSIALARQPAHQTGSLSSPNMQNLPHVIVQPTSPRSHADLRSTSPRDTNEDIPVYDDTSALNPSPPPPPPPYDSYSQGSAGTPPGSDILSSSPTGTGSSMSINTSLVPRDETGATVKKKTARREKSGTKSPLARTASTRNAANQLKNDLLAIAMDIETSHTDLSLLIRALETEAGVTMAADDPMKLGLTKEQHFLDKMLANSYVPQFPSSPSQREMLAAGVSLAPVRLYTMSELLVPPVNMAALGAEELLLLQHLEFNVFPYKDANNEHHVRLLLMAMFYEFDLPRIFQIPDVTLYRFFTVISRKYRQVPFHNFYHAFNVTQTMYFFLKTGLASRVLGPLEIMACLVAAVCHDLDHPGLNNDFQRKMQTRVYAMHKKSVLENHHYLQCMAALTHSETNILVNLTAEEDEQIHIYLRDLILATDLAVHGIILKNLTDRKKILAKFAKAGSGVGMNEEDRKLIMVALMKCSDLSNEVRENTMSKAWAKLVMEEFFAQSDLERQLKLPVTPFMDKEKIIITKEQINFIEKLCLPLYTQLAGVFSEIERCCQQLDANRAAWLNRLRLFFSSPDEIKKLSNKSIWEREQVKTKGSNLSISSTLSMLATDAGGIRRDSRRTGPKITGGLPRGEPSSSDSHMHITITSGASSSNAASSSAPHHHNNVDTAAGLNSSSSTLAAPPGPLLSSVSSPDISINKKDREKEKDKSDKADKEKDKEKDKESKDKDKEKDKKDGKDGKDAASNRLKESSRATSTGPVFPNKTTRK